MFHSLTRRFSALFAALAVSAPALASAQESLASQETSVAGGTLMLVAYIILWVLIFAFIVSVVFKQRSLDRELAVLEKRMDDVFDEEEPS